MGQDVRMRRLYGIELLGGPHVNAGAGAPPQAFVIGSGIAPSQQIVQVSELIAAKLREALSAERH